jgi:hypothetical protein
MLLLSRRVLARRTGQHGPFDKRSGGAGGNRRVLPRQRSTAYQRVPMAIENMGIIELKLLIYMVSAVGIEPTTL